MPLETHFPADCEALPEALEFLNRIFVYDPIKRPGAI